MIAPAHLDLDESGRIEDDIRAELSTAGIECIAVASVLPPRVIAKKMGVGLNVAKRMREAAKRHVMELWAFEDAAWERE